MPRIQDQHLVSNHNTRYAVLCHINRSYAAIRTDVDVVIVGAGPGGATCALALSHLSADSVEGVKSVLLLDRHSRQRARSNTLLLDQAASSALETLGCDISAFSPASDWTQICPEESVLNQYPLPAYKPQPGRGLTFSALFMLRRTPVFNVGINMLEESLYRRIQEKEELGLRHDAHVTEVVSCADGSCLVRYVAEGIPQEVHTRFVIAADGTNSATLQALGVGKKRGVRRMETLISANFKQAGRGNTKYHNNNRSEEALSLATDHGTSVFVKVPDGIEWENISLDQDSDKQKLLKLLEHGAQKLGISGDINYGLSVINIRLERTSQSVYRKNVFVIGDARHSTTPRVALGANVAIMDALRAAQAISWIYGSSPVKRHLARPVFRVHTWLGAHILGFLGAITGSSQRIKSKSNLKRGTVLTQQYKFWKTQLLMSFHWRAATGKTWAYDVEDTRGSLQDTQRAIK
ncbi:MAG: NAD(P)/FAD-dependent oxidoreductase [Halieaceae bacterium]